MPRARSDRNAARAARDASTRGSRTARAPPAVVQAAKGERYERGQESQEAEAAPSGSASKGLVNMLTMEGHHLESAKSDALRRPCWGVAVAVLCHICHRPTLLTCRNCGRPACEEHIAVGVCVECRAGRRVPRPGVRA